MNGVTRALTRFALEEGLPADVDQFRKGLSLVNAGWRGHSQSEVVGCPRAGLLCLDLDLAWFMSHDTVDVYISAIRDHLLGRPVAFYASARTRARIPQVQDYLHRPECLRHADPLTFFENYARVPRTNRYERKKV